MTITGEPGAGPAGAEAGETGAAAGETGAARASRPVKRSFSIRGHRTSISLEAAFWEALGEIAAVQGHSLAGLVAKVDAARGDAGLSGAVRIYILDYYRALAGK